MALFVRGSAVWLLAMSAGVVWAQPPVPVSLDTQEAREETVNALRDRAEMMKAEAEAVVLSQGGPIRGMTPDGQLFELIALEKGKPLYFITQNSNAAISTAADLVRNTAPYNVNGLGHTVGVWDGGSVLSTHQEFGGRVNVMDGAASNYHSTHVGGRLARRA